MKPRTDLFPPLSPNASGMLQVDGIHTLYWEESGTPNGVPVIFLHGGPGSGSSPVIRRYFDPKDWRIILFDQRGAGRSKPHGELRANTTEHLIHDIERLREHLNVKKWHVFGGSWGSTLALAYGEAHPECCLSFMLRGIFLFQKTEIDWFMYGMRKIFPELWETFATFIHPEKRDDLLQAYFEILSGPDVSEKYEAIRRWLNYETACSTLTLPKDTDPPLALDDLRTAMPVLEAHYFLNNRPTPDTKLLDNVHRIRPIPAVLVHGRYDMLCPVETAYALHRAWPESKLKIIPDAGHAVIEKGIRAALIEATEEMKKIRP